MASWAAASVVLAGFRLNRDWVWEFAQFSETFKVLMAKLIRKVN